MTRFGNKARTKADKRAAALQFVIMSEKDVAAKVETLQRSYGFTPAEAEKFVKQHGRAA